MLFQAWLLVFALSIDAFVCSFSYGSSKIKIPFKSMILINVISTIMIVIGIYLSDFIILFLSDNGAMIIVFIILFTIGVIKLFESIIKSLIRKYEALSIILKIYADHEKADVDDSKELSLKEAIPLAIALGLDGLSVGIAIGLTEINSLLIISLSLISDMLAILLGSYLGNKVAIKIKINLSWLAGVVLILLALFQVW